MPSRLAVAIALALAAATTQASDPVRPLPGETQVAFQCRAAFAPDARACVQRCDAAFAGQATERFECTHACTKRGLHDMAACRSQGGVAAVASVLAAR